MSQGEHETGSAGADGMADRDRAAVHVDAPFIQLEHARRVQGDRGKRLVDLDQVQVAGLEARFLEGVGEGERGHGVQPRVTVGAHAVRDHLCERFGAQVARTLLAHDDHRRRAI